ncbi:hypothetical protein [Variovorax sp. AFSI2.2]
MNAKDKELVDLFDGLDTPDPSVSDAAAASVNLIVHAASQRVERSP